MQIISAPPCVHSRSHSRAQAERERREAERRAKKDADRQAIADAMETNYLAWHNREEDRLAREVVRAAYCVFCVLNSE